MEDNNQQSIRGKRVAESDRVTAEGIPCAPRHQVRASSDALVSSPDYTPLGPIATPVDGGAKSATGASVTAATPEASTGSFDCRTTRMPDCDRCRECLGALAHRLAQPMTALRGGIELGMIGKRSTAEYRSLLEQSLQLADGVVQLIVSLRDLGESSAPGGPAQHVVLEDLAAESLAKLEVLAQSRDTHLQLRVEGEPKACANHQRVREAFHSLLAWIIQNSAGGDDITVRVATSEREVHLFVSLSRTDLQYIQIKVLEDITTPGSLFAHATKNGVLGWAINQHMWKRVGGRLEILTEGQDAGSVRVSLPLATAA